MATDNSTQEIEARELRFPTSHSLYQLNPSADNSEIYDQLSARLSQLTAMLTMVHGNGFESFSQWNDEIQDNYLWACTMLATECRDHVDHPNFGLVSKPSQEEA